MKEQKDQQENKLNKKELQEMVLVQNEKIDALIEMMSGIVSELPAKKEIMPQIDTTTTQNKIEATLPPEVKNGLPPPSKWQQKVNDILGEDFALVVEESSGGNYLMKVFLPPYLDRRTGEKEGLDTSCGLVRRASDIADVEKWCNLIKANIQKFYPLFKK